MIDDLVAAGFPAPVWDSTSARRFMVFYDEEHVGNAAGIAALWFDDSPDAGNLNNLGGRYAVVKLPPSHRQWRSSSGRDVSWAGNGERLSIMPIRDGSPSPRF